MSLIQWRQLAFFEQEEVFIDSLADTTHLAALWQNIDVCCHCYGRGHMVLGDSSGFVHLVDKSLSVSSFPAHERTLVHLVHLKQQDALLTVGYGLDSSVPVLKCWDLDKLGEDKSPLCTRIVLIQSPPSSNNLDINYLTVSAVAVCENSLITAIAFDNGSVMFLRGDLVNDRYVKQRIVQLDPEQNAITGLSWQNDSNDYSAPLLYVSTEESVSGYRITSTGENREFSVPEGCKANCSGSNVKGDFVIARPEALYIFGPEGRGPCFVLDDVKSSMCVVKNYSVMLGHSRKKTESDNDGIIIYDLKNKFIAHSSYFKGTTPAFVVYAWGHVFVFTVDKKIYRLKEKDTDSKLETLYNKNMYTLAINLVTSNNLGDKIKADVFRRFGDHLYSRGDYDGAVEQYNQTIGTLQPSYVILKFLDAQRIHNLTSYLQRLHEKNLATPDHTTLLLNCYAKMQDSKRLTEFIKRDDVFFDVGTAINVCRAAKFPENALILAEKFNRHEEFIEIQLEDLENYRAAIAHINRLDIFDAEKIMKRYGKMMVSMAPAESTKVLLSLCDGSHTQSDSDSSAKLKSRPEDFIHNFVNQKKWLMEFLEKYLLADPTCNQEAVWNTLFELYLSPHDDSTDTPKESQLNNELQSKALNLLKNPNANYNIDLALVLCQLHQFLPGLLQLYERNNRYAEILQFHMDNGSFRQIIATCKKFGDEIPDLWVQTLSYFADRSDDCKPEMAEVLDVINNRGLLSALQVIDILSRNTNVTLGLVKDFVLKQLDSEMKLIEHDQADIERLEAENEALEHQISELESDFITFQVTRCTACSNMLDLPAVHFLCKHSYHIRCLAENEKECPKCSPAHKHNLDIFNVNQLNRTKHEQFVSELSTSKDPFITVAEYFGKSIFVEE